MHECLLCERDMKRSKTIFGNGCIKNIYNLLELSSPKRIKNREDYLYKTIRRKAKVSSLNKEQKIWLLDRYLTYQYLNKINWGDLNKIKEEINTDIQNVNKVSKFDDLKTAGKIKLKQAYDLYKKILKFEEGINQLRNVNFNDEQNKKLLISNISFIFNMGRNKSQYEKDSFKAMQYAFWQTVIEVGGKYFDFDISANLLQHSLEEKPEDLVITEGKIIYTIKKDNQFQENINNIVKKYGNNKEEFIFDSKDNKDFPMNFNNSDLYFAIHSAELKVTGKKQNEKWNLNIKLDDRYDYSKFKDWQDYYFDTNSIPKSIFSSTLYNLAYYSMKLKVMKEYDIDIQFELNDFEVMQ